MSTEEERIALFLDYENLAIGARENMNGITFDFRPVTHALADRGRVVARKAYADWSYFEDDRRMLTRNHVELIEIPQRMGTVRKNAADIKLACDAIEMAYERPFITTYVICTGDSDFTPLVDKLRALNKRVIGVGVEGSTSGLLPPACDEFLFYDRLEGVEIPREGAAKSKKRRPRDDSDNGDRRKTRSIDDVSKLLTGTLSGLQNTSDGVVHASGLKRAMLRKDPTFNEAEYGFRGFRELIDHLESKHVIETHESPAKGDPEVGFPNAAAEEEEAFVLLSEVVAKYHERDGQVQLSGLKNKMRRRQNDFTEKRFGFGSFLQFVKAAATRGYINYDWNADADDYLLSVPDGVG